MGRKCKYLSIAVALTALDLLVALRYGVAVWQAYSDLLPVRLLLLFFVVVWIASLADVWSRASYRDRRATRLRRVRLSDIAASTAARGEASDV